MAGEIDTGVNDISERIEIAPSGDDELVELPEDTDPNSPEGNDGDPDGDDPVDPENDPADDSPDGKPEHTMTSTPASPEDAGAGGQDPDEGNKRLPDETPREYARRLEIEKLRGQLRKERTGEILDTVRGAGSQPAKAEMSPEAQEVLGKYKPEELSALEEVFPIMAAKFGFVRKDEQAATSYQETVQTELDSFIEAHPEYKPENDPDGALWEAFKSEFGIYRQPSNAKDYKRIFAKVHQSVFGIQAGTALPKVEAQRAKVQTASHAGASGPTPPPRTSRTSRTQGHRSGLRLDALKGFDQTTIDNIAARAQGD